MDFSYYIMDEEVYADMKMTFQPKKRQRAKVHGFRARMYEREVLYGEKNLSTKK